MGGGIGSGKSSVRRMLEEHGVVGIDADEIGHDVLLPDGPAFESVAARWPEVVRDGRIDRARLAAIVFEDAGELSALEGLTHPHIFGRIGQRLEEVSGVAVVEVPLLNPPSVSDWGRLVVDCSDEVRLARVVARGMAEGDARARMASQPSRAEWLTVADVVVPNHGGLEELWGTVRDLVDLL